MSSSTSCSGSDYESEARKLAKEFKVKKHYFLELAKVQLFGSRDADLAFVTIEMAGTPELCAQWAAYLKEFARQRNALQIAHATQVLQDAQSKTGLSFELNLARAGGVEVASQIQSQVAVQACKSIRKAIEDFAAILDDSYGIVKKILRRTPDRKTFEFLDQMGGAKAIRKTEAQHMEKQTEFHRRYSTNATSLGGLFTSVVVRISKDQDLHISKVSLGSSTTIYQGRTSDVVAVDHVVTTAAEMTHFHARIHFASGQLYELPMPLSGVEIVRPGAFDELRDRLGLSGDYLAVSGGLAQWDRLIGTATV